MTALTDYMEGEMITHLFRTGELTVPVWAGTTAYAVGDIVHPIAYNDRFFICVVAGTSAAGEPTWTVALGSEDTDNTVTWQSIALGVPKKAHFIALYTAAPGETGGGTEVTGGSYARDQFDPADANWAAPTAGDGLTDNVLDIVFPAPTAAWGVVSDFAILTRSTAGDFIIYGSLTTSKTVNSGDPAPKFSAGDLDITFA